MKIKIKYFWDMDKIEKIDIGDWIDLRCARDIQIYANNFCPIPLGVAMELPKGYEAHVVPRSSTYKNFKVIQTNHMGVIDESYCGDYDMWYFPAYALEDTWIPKNVRICQFRIVKKMEDVELIEVKQLNNPDRDGCGSTGIK